MSLAPGPPCTRSDGALPASFSPGNPSFPNRPRNQITAAVPSRCPKAKRSRSQRGPWEQPSAPPCSSRHTPATVRGRHWPSEKERPCCLQDVQLGVQRAAEPLQHHDGKHNRGEVALKLHLKQKTGFPAAAPRRGDDAPGSWHCALLTSSPTT